jgi:hypothetical protein
MPTRPREFATLRNTFAALFSTHGWEHVHGLVVGAILAPGKRTIPSGLRVMALGPPTSVHH